MVIYRLTRKDILFAIRWVINVICVIFALYILLLIYYYGIVIIRIYEPNTVGLIIEIIVLTFGIILNIYRFREYLGE